jgi:hypothetical protein
VAEVPAVIVAAAVTLTQIPGAALSLQVPGAVVTVQMTARPGGRERSSAGGVVVQLLYARVRWRTTVLRGRRAAAARSAARRAGPYVCRPSLVNKRQQRCRGPPSSTEALSRGSSWRRRTQQHRRPKAWAWVAALSATSQWRVPLTCTVDQAYHLSRLERVYF